MKKKMYNRSMKKKGICKPRMLQKAGIVLLLGLMSFTLLPQKKITVYLIGDSTVSDKAVSTYPETGWGMPFKYYFDTTVVVDNRAKNGRSTRTFIEEGRWKSVMKTLKAGDYVLIQFGHNDEVPTKGSYTPPDQFMANLVKFITDTRSRQATPVLITPVARRRFDSAGHVVDTHAKYAALVRKVAKEQHTALIDLTKTSMQLLQQLGPEESKFLWLNLSKGENPHYPDGRHDNTHFNELGARKMAELVLKGIKDQHLDLTKRIQYR